MTAPTDDEVVAWLLAQRRRSYPLTSYLDGPSLPGITPASACTGCGAVTSDDLLWVWDRLACCETCAAAHPLLARVMADDLF